MALVKIVKISESAAPDFKTADWKSWIPGEDNGNVSPPVDYTVKGTLAWPIEEGNTIHLHRTERNGVKTPGLFVSSKILKIASNERAQVVWTRNSIYLVEREPEED